jgi:hypothetical protein
MFSLCVLITMVINVDIEIHKKLLKNLYSFYVIILKASRAEVNSSVNVLSNFSCLG